MNDIVVFGATGFVGRLVADYLAEHAPTHLEIALAGRTYDKLAETRAALGPKAAGWSLIVADSSDTASLDALAAQARVVASTVGPYRRDGLKLVDACIANHAAYLDLTGEILFAHESVTTRHHKAAERGVKIVHSCGFDSIPSDLGVFILHQAVGPLGDTTLAVTKLKGGMSGGTVASMKGQIDEANTSRDTRKLVFDPFSLGGDGPPTRDFAKVVRHKQLGWLGPFLMATYNTRIVRRSAHVLDYGPHFTYREVSRFKDPFTAVAMTAGLGALAAGLSFPPTRKLLDMALPDPGEGPSEAARRSGHFTVEIHANGHRATVAGQGDPGYQATAVMFGESALALALDRERLPELAGVLTPATALGAPLVDRLKAAGMTFEVDVNER